MPPPELDGERQVLQDLGWVRRNGAVVVGFLAVVVGGVELRYRLSDALADIHDHVSRPAHVESARLHALTAQRQDSIEKRLDALEAGQSEIHKAIAASGATQTQVLDSLKQLRDDLRDDRRQNQEVRR